MKIFKLIGVIAVIGIGLWASTVHAQNEQSRKVDLNAVSGLAPFARGQLVIKSGERGVNRNRSGFIPDDGEPHPFVDLQVSLPCRHPFRDDALGGDFSAPRTFYALYITRDDGDPIRVISFNTPCHNFQNTIFGLLPATEPGPTAIAPNDWFTKDLLVQVLLELDDGEDGVDIGGTVVLTGMVEGTD